MNRLLFLILAVFIFFRFADAQISPGDLTTAHQNLEGTENCTKCHSIGKTISSDNCSACHTEIKTRMSENKGFHATVKGKECIECHKEHHGRNFSIIRFDKQTFDHSKVGFVLEGKHATLKCEQCHEPSKIKVKEIQSFPKERKQKTYLGLSPDCQSCHKDEHKGQFTKACTQCHTTKQWKPAPNFSHEKTQFQLTGSHTTVECIQCHKKTWADNSVMQFIDIKFNSCSTCHTDPHKGKFKQECSQCHTTESWHNVKSAGFNHNETKFPLSGKHAGIKCETCHPKDAKAKNISGGIGFHITKFQQCKDCHADAHGKQFDNRKDVGMCESCHSVEGFSPSKYSVADHIQARFALTGSHLAIPCIKCHVDGKVKAKSSKIFRWIGDINCETCHKDIHNGQFKSKMTNGCVTCHSTEDWKELKFSHEKTNFPLHGKHAETACEKCHKSTNGVILFVGTAKECNSCHQDQHAGQFEIKKITRCERCHSERGWKLLLFDHNTQAKFALTGKHETVACEKCHREAVINAKRTIKYKPLESACINCHPDQ